MLFAVALICAIGTVGYNYYIDTNTTVQERLILTNIEALTSSETPGGGGTPCGGPKTTGTIGKVVCKSENTANCSWH